MTEQNVDILVKSVSEKLFQGRRYGEYRELDDSLR